MDFLSMFRAAVSRCLLGLIFLSFLAHPAYCLESEDAQIFITGFNAYQKKDYQAAVDSMALVLQKYPDTPLRDMSIFWLARANYKAGHREDAAKYMAKFFREYPDSPLKGTVEDELVQLAQAYERGEKLPPPREPSEAEKSRLAEAKAAAEKAEAARKREAERATPQKGAVPAKPQPTAEPSEREKADAERLAAEKAAEERSAKVRQALKDKADAKRRRPEAPAEAPAAGGQAVAAAVPPAASQPQSARPTNEEARTRREAEQAEADKAAAQRLAEAKAAAEKAAAERAAAEKVAAEKAEAERRAEAQAARERAAAERAAAEKAAAEKAAAERLAAQRAAEEKAAAERNAAAKAAADKEAAERSAQAQAAKEKAAAERMATEKAALERAAAEKAVADKAAAKAEQERLALAKSLATPAATPAGAPKENAAAPSSGGAGRETEKATRSALKERAIADYRDIIARYPGTPAAASAAARLQELGASHERPRVEAPAPAKQQPTLPGENAAVLNLEVAQLAGVDFSLRSPNQPVEVNRVQRIPFEVVNQGNGQDSFYLESGFPGVFAPQFAAATRPDTPVNATPTLSPGEKFQGVLSVTIPPGFIDGAKVAFPVKAGSRFSSEASQSRNITMTASAPLLRMVLKADKVQLLPGDKVSYRVALLNIGSAPARGVTLRLGYPPQYEPVDPMTAGFKQEMKSALVVDGLQLSSGETKEYTAVFQLREEALAQQELFLRGEVVNNDLRTKDAFIATPTFVQAVSGVSVKATSERLVVIPGQTVSVPLIITNTGNIREDFTIRAKFPDTITYTFYQDLNRDGVRQSNEPVINHVGPLAPREESYVVLEVVTPSSEKDRSEAHFTIAFESETNRAGKGTATVNLLYSRPVVDLTLTGRGGKLKPGEVSTLELTCTNRGSNMAKMVELVSQFPAPLELVVAEPSFASGKNGTYSWKFDELGPGEKKSISISYRMKEKSAVGTSVQMKNTITYQDQVGIRY